MPDAIGDWLNAAGRVPLLTPAEELHLGTIVRQWQDSEEPDAKLIRRGQKARQRIISANLRLVAVVARKYIPRMRDSCLSLEDLLQEGCVGLNRAAEKFDPAKGYKFSTYAYWWIAQGISRVLDHQGAIKRPSSAAIVLNRWRHKPEEQTFDEFCEQWNYSPEKVTNELMTAARADVRSLDAHCNGDSDGSAVLEMIEDERSRYDLDQLDRELAVEALRDALPQDVELIELSMVASSAEVAEFAGVSIAKKAEVLQGAKERLREAYAGVKVLAQSELESVAVRQNVVHLSDYKPLQSMNGNGLAKLEALVEQVQAEPEPAVAAPVKRRRRTKEELAAAGIKSKKAAVAPAGVIKLVVNGVSVEAGVADAAALLRQLAA